MRAAPRSEDLAPLVAAYREGLGLAAIVVVGGSQTQRFIALDSSGCDRLGADGEVIDALLWCARADDAARVAAAMKARLRRRESKTALSGARPARELRADLSALIENTAERLGIVLYSDAQIAQEAARVITHVDERLAAMQRSGELKAVNRSYRLYRRDASARGKKVLPYVRWFNKYRTDLVRQIAVTLRSL